MSNVIGKLTSYGASATVIMMSLMGTALAHPETNQWWTRWQHNPPASAPELSASLLLVGIAIAGGLIYLERRRTRQRSIEG